MQTVKIQIGLIKLVTLNIHANGGNGVTEQIGGNNRRKKVAKDDF